jgi:uncharacterized protein (TIGR02444 family)
LGTSEESGNPFWDFSLEVYARPGVPEACVGLQDRRGLDVNILLFALWAGSRGRRLSKADHDALGAAAAAWQYEVVRPLRSVRRALKKTGASAGERALRECVKHAELVSEEIEQRLLFDLGGLGDVVPDSISAAADNLLLAASAGSAGTVEQDRQDLRVLLRAAFPALGGEESARLV